MYSRLRDGLLSPSAVVDYIKDKWYKPFFQILLFALIICIPTIISVITYDGLSYEQKLEIRQEFNNEEIPFEIIDGVLVCSQGNDYIYTKEISEVFIVKMSVNEIQNEKLSSAYIIEFTKEKVVLNLAGIKMDIFSYNSIDSLKNFDLSKLGGYNNISEWDIAFSVCNSAVKEYLSLAIVGIGLMTFFESAILLLALAFIISLSFLMKFSRLLKYGAMYKMSVYYLAPFVLGYLLSIILNFGILYYIGFILSIIYSFIGSNVIVSRLMNQGRK